MEYEKKQKFITDFLYYSFVFLLIYFSLKIAVRYLLPFIIGGVIAIFSRKICSKKTEKNVDWFSVFTVAFIYILLLVLIIGLCSFVYNSKKDIIDSLSDLSEKTVLIISNIAKASKKFGISKENIYKSIQKIATDIISKISNSVADFAVSISEILIDMFVVIVSSIYIAKDYNKLKKILTYLLGKKRYNKITEMTCVAYTTLKKMVSGYVVLFIITFIELSVAFFVLKIQIPVFIAFLVSFVDILPILGVGTVLIPWSIIEFLNQNIFLGVAFLITYLIITIIRSFLEPHILGKRIDINPLFTLVLIFVGLKLEGLIGVIIVPLAVFVILGYYKKEMKIA